MSNECSLCGRSIQSSSFEAPGERAFCSSGCHDVYATLGVADPPDVDRSTPERTPDGHGLPDSDDSRTFLRIDGMYSATCEAYLESLAENRAGVTAAE
ncbi:cation-transporting P-type ATPase, partial [Halorubrum sp. SS7]